MTFEFRTRSSKADDDVNLKKGEVTEASRIENFVKKLNSRKS